MMQTTSTLSSLRLSLPPTIPLNHRLRPVSAVLRRRSIPLLRLRYYDSALSPRLCLAAASQDSELHAEMAGEDGQDPRIPKIASAIRVIPNFPKPGIMFQDITTLLLDTRAFRDTIDLFVERYKGKDISVVAGVEARGFIFGPPIALAIGAKFVPMRKPKKLPGIYLSIWSILLSSMACYLAFVICDHYKGFSFKSSVTLSFMFVEGPTPFLQSISNIIVRFGGQI
ncbi:PREDICTED: adenine phosphoribosyltransferase 1, chloroplastic-like, partial [Tarenaya hassleriana]|uniref:adenine phosphoribosyltransferase 1, chloroplastic-like n=1 Tax=Tarenaya hassleriana TaxID=28532 RepID=UPI00053C6455